MRVLLIDADVIAHKVAYATVDETEPWPVQRTLRRVFEKLCVLSGCTHYIGYLTDSPANFRITRATTWPYKGNRVAEDGERAEKPSWFPVIRRSYQDDYGFHEVSGIEADDALTISAEILRTRRIPVACATIDKDLKQYPWDVFVDMNTDTVYSISPESAHRALWKQMLIGDKAVDNIPGLSHAADYMTPGELDPKIRAPREFLLGATGADKLLASWDPSDYASKTYEMYLDAYWGYPANTQAVADICQQNKWTFGEYRFHETWDLIHMLLVAPKGVAVPVGYQKMPEVALVAPMASEFDDCGDI